MKAIAALILTAYLTTVGAEVLTTAQDMLFAHQRTIVTMTTGF